MEKRIIKFRAWNPAMRQMIEPEMLFINTESDDGTCSLATTIQNLQENFELMQHTGLKDANGKEIYEGDIFSFANHGASSIKYPSPMVCEFEDGGWNVYDWAFENIEVIGNLYEHPHLMKQEIK